ncbi:MAG TPA: response regulator transcription factor [Patescibacteria group bacterium]|nr:response regulator transcription factor [Patescibacteria group bacterium]
MPALEKHEKAPPGRKLADLPHVLIVDDDDRIRDLVSRYLTEHGFVVSTAGAAAEAREVLKRLVFDALVVDVMMPGETGLEFTKKLRAERDIPVLLLTALGETGDRIAGLESGADDYLPKPFEPRELVLRLQAILRRRQPVKTSSGPLKVGRWLYDAEQNELRAGDEVERLTSAEGTLLQVLAARAGQTIGREELATLCGVDSSGRTIDVQVTRLRRKLEDDPKAPRCLQTVRGKGYRLLAGEA